MGGATYTFVLSATYSENRNQIDKYEMISILMNEPPYGGVVTSSPYNGTALDTVFLFETQDWNDDPDDIPLQYVIATYAEPSSKSIVQTMGETTYVETTVGQGLEDNGFLVYVEVEAYDIYGAMANTESEIECTPMDESLLAAAADSALESAFASSDPVAVSSVINAVSASLNTVNCTVPTACATLNREACVNTPKTCGVCLPGFLGVDGDANSQCSDPNALKRTGDTCSTDDDCITNYCSDESICSERNKECMNECSPELGAGTCVFRSIIDNSVLSECAQSATTCRAVCEDCTSGYYGLDCSLSQSDYDSKVALRDTLCASIYDTVAIQDITEDVMKSRCTTLSGLLKDPSQLSSEAISNCTSALVLTIEASPEYAGLDTVSSLAAQTLSKVLNLPLGAGLLLNVSETLKSLTGSVQDNLAVGEAQKDFNTANARIGAQVLDPSALASTTFSPPQSDTEKFNGAPINNLSVEMGSSVSAVGISVVQYNNNPTGSVTDNIPIAIQTTDYASARRRRRRLQHLPPGAIEMEDGDNLAIAGRRRRLSSSGSNTVTLQLKNNEDITYFSIPENSSWVFCEDLPYDYNETVSCPAINATSYETYYVNFTFECFKNSPRNYSYTCPASEKLPECKTYDGVDFTVDSSCTLKSYTAKETICECNVDNDGGRRLTEYDELGRRLSVSAAAKSELRQFSATAGILGGSFVKTVNVVNTFNADDDPNNKKSPGEKFVRVVSGNAVIFFFMLTIVIITIVGILLTALKDRVEVKRWAEQLVSTKETRNKIVAARDITKFVNDAVPLEFTGIPWHIRFWKRMTEEHDWLACFLPYKESHAESWAQFTMGMGKVCNFLFVDTILSALFFADDGTCETFQTEEDCLFLRALSQVDSLCEWEFDYDTFYNATVYYNVSVENPVYNGTDLSLLFGSCSFSGASSEFMPTLILVIVITIFTIPFDRIVEFLAGETAALFLR